MMPPCTGRLYYQSDREQEDHTLLVAVPCRVGSISRPVFALLDTASEWCVLPHDLAVELAAELELLPVPSSLHTRFGLLRGTLGRLTIRFDAADGGRSRWTRPVSPRRDGWVRWWSAGRAVSKECASGWTPVTSPFTLEPGDGLPNASPIILKIWLPWS